MAESYLASARLRARLGQYDTATQECERALDILRQTDWPEARMGQAYVYAGHVYRYRGETDTAQDYYEQANSIFSSLHEWYDWQSQALAGLGATLYLIGVKKRERVNDISAATNSQIKSFNFLQQSLSLIRKHELETLLATIFDRLGDIYRELSILEGKVTLIPAEKNAVDKLRDILYSFELPEEVRWEYELLDGEILFQQLDTLGKAQRLFEIAFLQAESVEQYHEGLDSLTQAAVVAQSRGKIDHVRIYTEHVGRLRGTDYPQQEDLFLAIMDIIEANMAFEDQRFENALADYTSAFTRIAKIGGFGLQLMRPRLRELGNRILGLPREIGVEWCQRIDDDWSRDISDQQEMIVFIRGLRNQIVGMSHQI